MAKVGQFRCGTICCSSEEVCPKTNTCEYMRSDAKKSYSRTVAIRYTSAGPNEWNQTINGRIPEYSPSLPAELDIFCSLPLFVYEFCEVRDFLNDLKSAIVHEYLQSELENLMLSKLTVSEYSDTGMVIDWIFNYFQMYFTFDINDGNYWGTVMVNDEEGEFCNNVIKIRPEKRMEQVQAILATAVMLLR